MINEAELKRKFKNLVSTAQLVKKIAQFGYQGNYTEQAIYKLLDKYGIKPKTQRGGKAYFNKKNACTCIERHIFELKELAEQLEQQQQMQQQSYEEPSWTNYGRNDMSVASREQLANDGVFGSDENELYVDENAFNFNDIVSEILNN
jgi:predicted flavoprotein YhiN